MTKPSILIYDLEYHRRDGTTVSVPRLLSVDELVGFVEMGDCWEWKNTLPDGYGRKSWWLNGTKVTIPAHRWVYESLVGPIEGGLELDHLCRNRACVNPDHLEPVTRQENHLRGRGKYNRRGQSTCKRGHDLSDSYFGNRGQRNCKVCAKARSLDWYYANKK